MKDIQDLIKTTDKYKNTVVQKRFKSEKNTVCYVILNEKPRVIKWYPPGLKRNMEIEYSVLKKGHKLNMPTVFEKDSDNNVIIISYIMGKNLCDFINDEFTSYEDKEKIVTKLARWFVDFHDYFKDNDFYIRGDSILRNFILNDKIWGVDFEESRVGKPIEDVACMCSSILTTDPMFTKEKFNLCTTFIRSYEESANWRLDNVKDEVAYAILERIQWRPDKENILRSFSNKIRKKGLLQ